MDAIELEVCVLPYLGRPLTLNIDIIDSTTTSDVLDTVKSIIVDGDLGKRRPTTWNLFENWMDIERRLPNTNLLPLLNEWGEDAFSDVKYLVKETVCCTPNRKLKSKNINKIMQLHEELFNFQYQIRQLRLMQVKRNMIQSSSDPAQRGLMVISSLNNKVKKMKASNEKLSSEVSEMNHEATKLSEHLSALRKESEHVVGLLTQMKAESTAKRDKEEQDKFENIKLLNNSTHRIQRELDKKLRITELQDQKLKKAQTDVTSLRANLRQKEIELTQLKEWSKEKKLVYDKGTFSSVNNCSGQLSYGSSGSGSQICSELPNDHESFGADSLASFESTSSFGSAFSRKTSGSIRRRFAEFEDRTKQILEEEGKAFKEAKPQKLQEHYTSRNIVADSESFSPVFLVSPLSDTEPLVTSNLMQATAMLSTSSSSQIFYSSLQRPKKPSCNSTTIISSSLTDLESEKPIKSILKKKAKNSIKQSTQNVKFTPESILLNAAWEGELDVLKDCLQKLHGMYKVISGLGVTCLHNAVCSGNLEMMDFLIQQNYDVNAQDYQGWTPLHCAVAYCIFSAIQLLIKNGASVFMTNIENMTPIDISKEEMEGTQSEEAKLCHTYLMEYHKTLGILNNATVFALFSYTPEFSTSWTQSMNSRHKLNEMPIIKGEKLTVISRIEDGWWEVKDNRGITGIVPSSYLGLYPPCQVS